MQEVILFIQYDCNTSIPPIRLVKVLDETRSASWWKLVFLEDDTSSKIHKLDIVYDTENTIERVSIPKSDFIFDLKINDPRGFNILSVDESDSVVKKTPCYMRVLTIREEKGELLIKLLNKTI